MVIEDRKELLPPPRIATHFPFLTIKRKTYMLHNKVIGNDLEDIIP